MKKVKVLSLGVGVQSSAIALMYENGDLKDPPDFAIFADTQREPDEVYEYLDYLQKKITKFPIYITSKGDLGDNPSKVPFFLLHNDGRKGMGWRQCTADYKIREVNKKLREVLGYEPRKRMKHHIEMIIGISTDEMQRVKKAREKWKTHVYPLIENNLSRDDCNKYFDDNNFKKPARSACYFCPYRSDKEWYEMQVNSPKDFQKAVEYDEFLRSSENLNSVKGQEYVHRSCRPLSEWKYKKKDKKEEKIDELKYGMNNECEGMCGL